VRDQIYKIGDGKLGYQYASYASGADQSTADVKRDLPAGDGSLGIGESHVRTIDRLGHCQ
jgi:hypothetical protein